MKVGGIVLCGGKSSRMGRAKAWLPLGHEFMLQRVVRVMREVTGPVVVVAAPDQDVPPLPPGVTIARDEVEGRGPLGGLAAGLAAVAGECDRVYLSACDVPFLRPEFVRRVVARLDEPPPPVSPPGAPEGRRAGPVSGPSFIESEGRSVALIAAPHINGFFHPLASAYRAEVGPVVRAMLAANRYRMTDLFDLAPTCRIGPEELSGVDPELASLRNLNTPDEYAAALRALGTAGDAPPAS